MAENMKEIKERIDSVKNTNQITNAMNIVSSTKFKKFQILTLKSREYSKTIETAFDNLVAGLKSHRYEIFDGKSEVKKIGIVVMTSDRGLCGSFNSNTLRKLEEMKKNFEKENKEVSVITIGKKAKDYCKSRNIAVDSEKILPIEKKEGLPNKEYMFEPSEEEVLRSFIPKVLNIKLYQSLLENSASEHSARMSAMKQASDNAEEMIRKLTVQYNRERQTMITQELSEIVSGSEALK